VASRSIYVETLIDADVEHVWAATQDPRQHVRWDVRFSEIVPEPADADGAARLTYVRRSVLHDVHGTGISIGERLRQDGTRTSALRFATEDRLSPIRDGRGYWRYVPTDDGRTRFITGYDYDSGWLRVWLEGGAEPEAWPLSSVLWVWRRDRPRASRTRRAPVGGARRSDHLRDAPATLATLSRPSGAR
jgi:hypothetical protein